MLDRDRRFPVPKAELLTKLRANREDHVATYKEAMEAWRKAAILALADQIAARTSEKANAMDGQPFKLSFPKDEYPTEPRTYAHHYDQVIGLLEMTTAAFIDINASDYRCYILDEWDWREEFTNTTMSYGVSGKKR